MYQINQKFIGQNRSYRALQSKGVVLHETANPGATDENHFNYFNNAYRGASAHVFVDWDSITQLVPWNERAWHAGPTANRQFLSLEMCRPQQYDPDRFTLVWNASVWCVAYMLKNICGITEVNEETLLSHAEVSNRWGETDHQDPISYLAEYGKTMDDFRAAVQDVINGGTGAYQTQRRVLKKGCKGSDVADLQYKLNQVADAGLVADGDFGSRTEAAVVKFQSAQGLTADGIVGEQTLAALDAAGQPKADVELTDAEAIQVFVDRGTVKDPTYWINHTDPYVHILNKRNAKTMKG
jgi:N-acetylmuramoyl-L-alanine amidase CwlA